MFKFLKGVKSDKRSGDKDHIDIPALDRHKSRIFNIPVFGNKHKEGSRQTAKLIASGTGEATKAAMFTFGTALYNDIKSRMPETNENIQAAVEIKDGVLGLVSDIKKNVQETIRTTKTAAKTQLPRIEGLLPSPLYKRLDKFLTVQEPTKQRQLSPEEQRRQQTNEILMSVFKEQDRIRHETDAKKIFDEQVQTTLEKQRHQESSILLDLSRRELTYQSRFLGSVLTPYLKKDLELKYQHMFIAQDTLGTLQVFLRLVETKLEDIKLNTSLPDVQKSKRFEALKGTARQKTNEFLLSTFKNKFAKQVIGNIKSKITDNITDVLDTLKMGAEMMTTMGEMQNTMGDLEDFDLDDESQDEQRTPEQLALIKSAREKKAKVKQAGGLAGWGVGKLLFGKHGKAITNKLAPHMQRVEEFSKHGAQKLSTAAARYAKVHEDEEFDLEDTKTPKGLLGKFLTLIAPLIPKLPQAEKDTWITNESNLEDSTKPAYFDIITKTSIVETIPGYLAKILQQVTTMATGTPAEELVFDVNSPQRFVATSQVQENIKSLFGKQGGRTETIDRDLKSLNDKLKLRSKDTYTFETLQKEVRQFCVNLANSPLGLLDTQFIELLKEITTKDNEELTTIISENKEFFEGVENLKQVAQCIIDLVTKDDGKIDIETLNLINNFIGDIRKSKDTGYTQKLYAMFNQAGMGRVMADMGLLKSQSTHDGERVYVDAGKVDKWQIEGQDTFTGAIPPPPTPGSTPPTPTPPTGPIPPVPPAPVPGPPIPPIAPPVLPPVPPAVPITPSPTIDLTPTNTLLQDIKTAIEQKDTDKTNTLLNDILTAVSSTPPIPPTITPPSIPPIPTPPTTLPTPIGPTISTDISSIETPLLEFRDLYKDISNKQLVVLQEISAKLEALAIHVGTPKGILSKIGEHFGKLVGTVKTKVKNLFSSVSSAISSPIKSVYKGIKSVFDSVKQIVIPYIDVYRKDNMTTPLLTANKQKQDPGVIHRGKRLKRTSDIEVPVFDTDGNQLITTEDIFAGLVDVKGKPITKKQGLAGKLLDAILPTKTIKMVWGKVTGAINSAKKFVNKIYDAAFKPFVDVYRKDKLEPGKPLLTIKQQQEGVWTGQAKPIKKSKEITVPVLDKDGNILITQEDIDAGLCDVHGNPLDASIATKLGGKLGKGLELIGKILGVTLITAPKWAAKTSKTIFEGVVEVVKEPFIDIYIKDKVEPGKPILSKKKQEEGVFFGDSSPVKRSIDIDKPVLDKDGVTLITEDDLKKGLVDVHNNPIGKKADGLLKRIGKGIGSAIKGIGSFVKALAIDLPLGALKGIGDFITGIFNDPKSKLGKDKVTKQTVIDYVETPLLAILSHLKEGCIMTKACPKGQIREGSYEDYWRDKKAAKEGQQQGLNASELAKLINGGKDSGKPGFLNDLMTSGLKSAIMGSSIGTAVTGAVTFVSTKISAFFGGAKAALKTGFGKVFSWIGRVLKLLKNPKVLLGLAAAAGLKFVANRLFGGKDEDEQAYERETGEDTEDYGEDGFDESDYGPYRPATSAISMNETMRQMDVMGEGKVGAVKRAGFGVAVAAGALRFQAGRKPAGKAAALLRRLDTRTATLAKGVRSTVVQAHRLNRARQIASGASRAGQVGKSIRATKTVTALASKSSTATLIIAKIMGLLSKIASKLPGPIARFFPAIKRILLRNVLPRLFSKGLVGQLIKKLIGGPFAIALTIGLASIAAIQGFRKADKLMEVPQGTCSFTEKLRVAIAAAISDVCLGLISVKWLAGKLGVHPEVKSADQAGMEAAEVAAQQKAEEDESDSRDNTSTTDKPIGEDEDEDDESQKERDAQAAANAECAECETKNSTSIGLVQRVININKAIAQKYVNAGKALGGLGHRIGRGLWRATKTVVKGAVKLAWKSATLPFRTVATLATGAWNLVGKGMNLAFRAHPGNLLLFNAAFKRFRCGCPAELRPLITDDNISKLLGTIKFLKQGKFKRNCLMLALTVSQIPQILFDAKDKLKTYIDDLPEDYVLTPEDTKIILLAVALNGTLFNKVTEVKDLAFALGFKMPEKPKSAEEQAHSFAQENLTDAHKAEQDGAAVEEEDANLTDEEKKVKEEERKAQEECAALEGKGVFNFLGSVLTATPKLIMNTAGGLIAGVTGFLTKLFGDDDQDRLERRTNIATGFIRLKGKVPKQIGDHITNEIMKVLILGIPNDQLKKAEKAADSLTNTIRHNPADDIPEAFLKAIKNLGSYVNMDSEHLTNVMKQKILCAIAIETTILKDIIPLANILATFGFDVGTKPGSAPKPIPENVQQMINRLKGTNDQDTTPGGISQSAEDQRLADIHRQAEAEANQVTHSKTYAWLSTIFKVPGVGGLVESVYDDAVRNKPTTLLQAAGSIFRGLGNFFFGPKFSEMEDTEYMPYLIAYFYKLKTLLPKQIRDHITPSVIANLTKGLTKLQLTNTKKNLLQWKRITNNIANDLFSSSDKLDELLELPKGTLQKQDQMKVLAALAISKSIYKDVMSLRDIAGQMNVTGITPTPTTRPTTPSPAPTSSTTPKPTTPSTPTIPSAPTPTSGLSNASFGMSTRGYRPTGGVATTYGPSGPFRDTVGKPPVPAAVQLQELATVKSAIPEQQEDKTKEDTPEQLAEREAKQLDEAKGFAWLKEKTKQTTPPTPTIMQGILSSIKTIHAEQKVFEKIGNRLIRLVARKLYNDIKAKIPNTIGQLLTPEAFVTLVNEVKGFKVLRFLNRSRMYSKYNIMNLFRENPFSEENIREAFETAEEKIGTSRKLQGEDKLKATLAVILADGVFKNILDAKTIAIKLGVRLSEDVEKKDTIDKETKSTTDEVKEPGSTTEKPSEDMTQRESSPFDEALKRLQQQANQNNPHNSISSPYIRLRIDEMFARRLNIIFKDVPTSIRPYINVDVILEIVKKLSKDQYRIYTYNNVTCLRKTGNIGPTAVNGYRYADDIMGVPVGTLKEEEKLRVAGASILELMFFEKIYTVKELAMKLGVLDHTRNKSPEEVAQVEDPAENKDIQEQKEDIEQQDATGKDNEKADGFFKKWFKRSIYLTPFGWTKFLVDNKAKVFSSFSKVGTFMKNFVGKTLDVVKDTIKGATGILSSVISKVQDVLHKPADALTSSDTYFDKNTRTMDDAQTKALDILRLTDKELAWREYNRLSASGFFEGDLAKAEIYLSNYKNDEYKVTRNVKKAEDGTTHADVKVEWDCEDPDKTPAAKEASRIQEEKERVEREQGKSAQEAGTVPQPTTSGVNVPGGSSTSMNAGGGSGGSTSGGGEGSSGGSGGTATPQVDMSGVTGANIPDGGAGDLGTYVKKFESGKKGPSAIGYDGTGGTSYGSYQFASARGGLQTFINTTQSKGGEFGSKLVEAMNAAKPWNTGGTSGAPVEVWRKFAGIDGGTPLAKLERKTIYEEYYVKALNGITGKGAKELIEKDRGLQEALWSTSVQHGIGGAPKIFNKTYKEGISPTDWLTAIYQERGTKFGSSTAAVRASVLRRFKEELPIVLGLSQSKPATTTGGESSSEGSTGSTGEASTDTTSSTSETSSTGTTSGTTEASSSTGGGSSGTADTSSGGTSETPQATTTGVNVPGGSSTSISAGTASTDTTSTTATTDTSQTTPSTPEATSTTTGETKSGEAGTGTQEQAAGGTGNANANELIKKYLEPPSDTEKINYSGLQPDFKKRFLAGAADFNKATGKKINVTSAKRTDEYQAQLWVRSNILKEQGLYKVAKPKAKQTINYKGKSYTVEGSGKGSPHLPGTAIDVSQSTDRNTLDKYMKPYGIGRFSPSGDPPHYGNLGTQSKEAPQLDGVDAEVADQSAKTQGTPSNEEVQAAVAQTPGVESGSSGSTSSGSSGGTTASGTASTESTGTTSSQGPLSKLVAQASGLPGVGDLISKSGAGGIASTIDSFLGHGGTTGGAGGSTGGLGGLFEQFAGGAKTSGGITPATPPTAATMPAAPADVKPAYAESPSINTNPTVATTQAANNMNQASDAIQQTTAAISPPASTTPAATPMGGEGTEAKLTQIVEALTKVGTLLEAVLKPGMFDELKQSVDQIAAKEGGATGGTTETTEKGTSHQSPTRSPSYIGGGTPPSNNRAKPNQSLSLGITGR
jgi:hypothetical protein